MFRYEKEAKIVYQELIKRFAKFGLGLEKSKTRKISFRRFKGTNETFDLLGFMHYNNKTKNGKYTVRHKMSKKKRKAKQKNITKWIKENKTNKLKGLIETINRKLVGLYAYYGN